MVYARLPDSESVIVLRGVYIFMVGLPHNDHVLSDPRND